MARPIKTGLDYFPLDVDIFRDFKLMPIKSRFGADGMSVYINLLCQIYRDKGYYIEMDDVLPFVVADETRVAENTVRQVMNFLLERAMFDNNLFQSDKILTSRSIQRRYQEATKRRGLKNFVQVNPRYWLLNSAETKGFIQFTHFEKDGKNEVFPYNNTGFCAEQSTKESKVKESKVKEIKEERRALFSPDSFEMKASAYLRSQIQQNFPNNRVPRSDVELEKWAVHIDRMKRIDKLTEENIRSLIRFAVSDSFWMSNILSTKKLREKRDVLFAQMTVKQKKSYLHPLRETDGLKEQAESDIVRRAREMGLEE